MLSDGNARCPISNNFRRETRAWLEANCPPEMRKPDDLGGRHVLGRPQRQSSPPRRSASGSSGCATRAGPCRTGRRNMAAAASMARRHKILRQEMAAIGARAAADLVRHLHARAGAAEIRHRGAEEGASAEDHRRPDPLVPGLFRAERRLRPRLAADPRRRATATTTSSTARRSGPPTPTTPTGSSAWCAPIPRRRSTTASASSCSTWPRRACRPSRSC